MAVSQADRVKTYKARVSKLLKDESGAVNGVEFVRNRKTETAYGPVILATGGYVTLRTSFQIHCKRSTVSNITTFQRPVMTTVLVTVRRWPWPSVLARLTLRRSNMLRDPKVRLSGYSTFSTAANFFTRSSQDTRRIRSLYMFPVSDETSDGK